MGRSLTTRFSLARGRRRAIAPTDRFRQRKQPKQERAALTRRRILDAAAQVFADHGYSAGTTNRIAECAGISIGSLYQYFPNKDAVLHALMEEHVAAGTQRLAARFAEGMPHRLDETLRLFVRATIDNHRDDPRLHRVLFEEAPRAPAFLATVHELERQTVEAAARLLEQHPEVGVHDPIRAHIVVVTIESLVHRLVTAQDPVDLGRLEDEIVALLSGYLRRDAPSARDQGAKSIAEKS